MNIRYCQILHYLVLDTTSLAEKGMIVGMREPAVLPVKNGKVH